MCVQDTTTKRNRFMGAVQSFLLRSFYFAVFVPKTRSLLNEDCESRVINNELAVTLADS